MAGESSLASVERMTPGAHDDGARRMAEMLADLESQAAAAFAAEREAEIRDRARAAYAEVTLLGRLLASEGPVSLGLLSPLQFGGPPAGHVARGGPGWVLLSGQRVDWWVPLAAVATVSGASSRAVAPAAMGAAGKLGIASGLRSVADAGEASGLELTWWVQGGAHGRGRLGRVGADFVEVLSGTGEHLLVPFGALVALAGPELV